MSPLQTGDTHMTKAEGPNSRTSRKAVRAPVEPTQSAKAPSKQECLAALLLRDEGATLDQMIAATGWLPDTTRAAMTGLRRRATSSTATRWMVFAPTVRWHLDERG